jgi:starch synthase
VKILFATAELRPLVSAGGLGEAAAGLVAAWRGAGHEVELVLPAYQDWPLDHVEHIELHLPAWASPASARRGVHAQAGPIVLVDVPGIVRPDPYVDADGNGWPDNDLRFGAFSAAVAQLAERLDVEVVQLNDWHTALVPAFAAQRIPTVLTIHNLGHQGWAGAHWLERITAHHDAYARGDAINALAGAITVCDRVATVSPTYAAEIVQEANGMGLHEILEARGHGLVGIRNGIDTRTWDPRTDPALAAPYGLGDLQGKLDCRAALHAECDWDDTGDAVVGMVTRLFDQKGVDLAFGAARFLEGMRARMVVLGSGERGLADWGRWLQEQQPDRFRFVDGYDAPLSHRIFAGSDLLLMPSRFEPCGLAQMQAMAYGTIPVVTAVGGLVDTVVDADVERSAGTGFVAAAVDEAGVVDALHRAMRSLRHAARRRGIVTRGMAQDWSWTNPAEEFVALYREIIEA